MTVIRDLRDLGFRVPDDISLAGFDGVRMGELLSPVLTTVVQPTAEIGRAAVDLLLQLIDGERYPGPRLAASHAAPGRHCLPQRSGALGSFRFAPLTENPKTPPPCKGNSDDESP